TVSYKGNLIGAARLVTTEGILRHYKLREEGDRNRDNGIEYSTMVSAASSMKRRKLPFFSIAGTIPGFFRGRKSGPSACPPGPAASRASGWAGTRSAPLRLCPARAGGARPGGSGGRAPEGRTVPRTAARGGGRRPGWPGRACP